jgi:hypothetical protein
MGQCGMAHRRGGNSARCSTRGLLPGTNSPPRLPSGDPLLGPSRPHSTLDPGNHQTLFDFAVLSHQHLSLKVVHKVDTPKQLPRHLLPLRTHRQAHEPRAGGRSHTTTSLAPPTSIRTFREKHRQGISPWQLWELPMATKRNWLTEEKCTTARRSAVLLTPLSSA